MTGLSFIVLGTALMAVPAAAQQRGETVVVGLAAPVNPHAGHAMPASPAAPTDAMDHDSMDHSAMDHAAMNETAATSLVPNIETPPPPEAGSGPPRAADAIWGAEAMRASRADLQRNHGDFNVLWLQADRLETQAREGANGYVWDVQGYSGGPTKRLWFKSEGDGAFGARAGAAEAQLLYSRAFAPFWDLQIGVRQDIAGSDTSHAVIGVQGLARYRFEIDAALFLSHRGDLTARIEGELDQRITQRLIVQPRAEVNLAAQDVPRLGVGAGIDSVELGVRLRYEIIREIAPYIGIEHGWRVGNGADYARATGQDPSTTNYVIGIRLWL